MTLIASLNIAGLLLDLVGAACLAYDVLYGHEARFQATVRHQRLATTNRAQARRKAQLLTLLKSPNFQERRVRWLRERIRDLSSAGEATRAELEHFQRHDQRARRMALVGLGLLMVGFASQGLASVLATTF